MVKCIILNCVTEMLIMKIQNTVELVNTEITEPSAHMKGDYEFYSLSKFLTLILVFLGQANCPYLRGVFMKRFTSKHHKRLSMKALKLNTKMLLYRRNSITRQ